MLLRPFRQLTHPDLEEGHVVTLQQRDSLFDAVDYVPHFGRYAGGLQTLQAPYPFCTACHAGMYVRFFERLSVEHQS